MEDNRCPGCMGMKTAGPVCEHCGFDEDRKNESHQLQIGTVLQEKYVVGRVLGQGGFGITYLGWNQYLEKKVAIKEYYPTFFVERHTDYSTEVTCKTMRMEEAFAENKLRFLREAKLLAKLQEAPQIVSILDYFEANNTAYIVMEYLQGEDLRAYVKRRGGRLSPVETFNIMRPVMAALVQTHEAGLVHRDISPDNIMLQYDGSVKLMDFGAARSVNNPDVDKELTQATQAIVKHGFAPVEQYSERGGIGPWTDEYALCATMYYCMTGRVPMNATDRIEEDTAINWDAVPGLTARQKGILQKGMAIRAKDRYGTIRELMGALFAQPAPVSPPPEPQKVMNTKKVLPKRTLVLIATSIILSLALVIILMTVFGSRDAANERGIPTAGIENPDEPEYQTIEPTDPPYAVMGTVTADNLNVRSEPSPMGDIVKRLAKNTRIEILEQRELDGVRWGRIAEGWIDLKYVELDGDAAGTDNGNPSGAVMGTVTADNLNVRSEPSPMGDIVKRLAKNTRIEILEQREVDGVRWGCIAEGWINMKYVELDGGAAGTDNGNPSGTVMGTVTADNLNVRSEPSPMGDIVKRLAKNTRIEILEQREVDGVRWGRIAEGWINLNYVKLDGGAAGTDNGK